MRFLLQSIPSPPSFEALTTSPAFIANLKLLGTQHLSFDIGVDQRSGGVWQLRAIAKAMTEAHRGVENEGEKVRFVVNHLCKPDFDRTGGAFEEWRDAVSRIAAHESTYIKLSGAFSELPDAVLRSSMVEMAACIKPWIEHVLSVFGPRRIMFGSDWPVCNVRGPRGEESWSVWREVVQIALGDPELGLSEEERDWIWYGTAVEAYRIGE